MPTTRYQTDASTSLRMRRVRSKDTTAEKTIRQILRSLGCRYRAHRVDLPGRPDFVLAKSRKIILVHGCFWHRHKGCPRADCIPKRNANLWAKKFGRTVTRDRANVRRLRKMGWSVMTVWECTLKHDDALIQRIARYLDG